MKKNNVIPVGSKVSNNLVIYKTTEEKVIGEEGYIKVNIQAEELGVIGNTQKETIKYFPISIKGAYSVQNENDIVGGFNEENDDSLRSRLLLAIREPATSGNTYHYKNWALEVAGVGAVKVIPVWNGGGTVKIIIIDSEGQPANELLLNEVHQHLEKERPICVDVTVVSALALNINITGELVIDNNFNYEVVIKNISEKLKNYFIDISFKDYQELSYAKTSYEILSVHGVDDLKNLKINENDENILLDFKVPMLGNLFGAEIKKLVGTNNE